MRFSELTSVLGWVLSFAFVFGCTIGSFLNVVVWRVPRGESLVTPPSHCPNCGHLIRPWENIPVLSWLCLRGRCSGCHLPISIRYPLGELATGFGYVLVTVMAWRRDLPVGVLPGYFFAFGILISVAQIDLKHGIIPDAITLTGLIVSGLLALLIPSGRTMVGGAECAGCGNWLSWHLAQQLPSIAGVARMSPLLAAGLDWLSGSVFGLFLLGGLSFPFWLAGRLMHRSVTLPVGWGDVKYLGMLGGFFGMDGCLFILGTGALLGFAYGLLRKLARRGRDGWSVCFGPFLSLSALLWMLFGGEWLLCRL